MLAFILYESVGWSGRPNLCLKRQTSSRIRHWFIMIHALSVTDLSLVFLKIRLCVCWCRYNCYLCQCNLLLLPLKGISDIFLFEERAQGLIICVQLSKWFIQAAANIWACVCVCVYVFFEHECIPCMCAWLSVMCACECVSSQKKRNKKSLELVNALIQNVFTSHEHDCNFKPLRESSCGALTGGR